MLMTELGFSPPRPDEAVRIFDRHARGEIGGVSEPEEAARIPSAVLSADPLVSYSGMARHAPLGVASVAGSALRERPAWFLLSPTSSIENDAIADSLRGLAVLHRRQNPQHRLIFVGNTPKEVGLLQERGEAAFFFNKTALTVEGIFRPLDGMPPDFEAIYNAQLAPFKRHELTLEIARCAFLFYRDHLAPDAAWTEATVRARHAAAAPGHVFVNSLDSDGVPLRLSHGEVNRQLNRARVGLCLSASEGAMFASAEYLLSGLSIVTTPSTGGREVYHDAEYCWTVPADARAVAEAVRALAARGMPRWDIQRRTLRRLEVDRARFLDLLNAILTESGSSQRLALPWPFRKAVTMQWLAFPEARDRAVHGVVDGYDDGPRRAVQWGRWRQVLRRLMRRRERLA